MAEKVKEISIHEFLEGSMPKMAEKDRKKQIEAIEQVMRDGIPLKESLKIAPDVIEFLYGQGTRHYMLKKYEEALKFFYMLYLLDAKDTRYSMGLGACYHMLNDFDQAMIWYLILSMIDPTNPMGYYHLSDCELKQGDKKSSLFFLNKALERIGENPKFRTLKERILRLATVLEEEINREEELTSAKQVEVKK